jgi:CRISPR-associated exonuclease Cas4
MNEQEKEYKEYITAADIKRYAWCPRIIYFTHVLHLEERVTEAMEEGKEEHDDAIIAPIVAQLKARKVIKGLNLVSDTLRLSGKPDFILDTKFGELVPVEVKVASLYTSSKAKKDHVMQLACYALLIEDNFKRVVKRCVVYYLRDKRVAYVALTNDLKLEAKKAIDKAYKIIEQEEMPKVRQPINKCKNCGYYRYCYPILTNNPLS